MEEYIEVHTQKEKFRTVGVCERQALKVELITVYVTIIYVIIQPCYAMRRQEKGFRRMKRRKLIFPIIQGSIKMSNFFSFYFLDHQIIE